ncbi:hypothetical protein J7T55_015154 [Diaporthe amygdali]|uniref:uncharacterized protein n=1 Tax=Phomopsis amygdali TaxID=1214568 RepID=UPI0022FEB745|nr:uncharacterized protein J7T55_015154 [Diaporthe amygdali]KAJ0120427.1 hypothetical protein J7T55_015154 [Diaporthe amygdali]
MFRKFRKSTRGGKATLPEGGSSHHVCHECGQSLKSTINSPPADQVAATPYKSTYPESRGSSDISSSSDSGYGSMGSSRHSEARLDFSDNHSTTSIPLPTRRPTYNSSIYSDASTFDRPARHQRMVEPSQVATPTYDHLFDLPPRTFTNYSEKWKPKSRYARLNELPAASPRAFAFPDDVLVPNTDVESDRTSTEKKRRSLILRPSSFRRLTARRSKSQ